MSPIRLRPGISHRSFEGCAILLDVEQDRYWQVSARMGAALDRVAEGEAEALASGDLAALERLGLVERHNGDRPTPGPVTVPVPVSSAIEGEMRAERFRAAEALEVAGLIVTARRMVRRRPLHILLDEIVQTRGLARQAGGADSRLLAQRFHRSRRLVPLSPLCLPDTIAFLRFAARRGCFPHLVFGVEAWPFAAHCWAQAGDCVLNDALDHARAFAPILVL